MNLDLYRKRLSSNGGSDRRDKLDYRNRKTLEKALVSSFNAEDVVKDGIESRALMLEDKLTLDVDQKWFVMMNESNLEPGDVLHVLRNDTRWIMVQEDLNERSFKRCVGSRAVYEVSWRDDNDDIQTSWASLRGPTETSIKTESRKHLLFDQGNEKMMLFLPSKAETKNLKRYKFLMVEGETWEIASTDPYTTPGVMAVALVEAQNNPYKDNLELGIARDDEFVFTNLFENDLTFSVNRPLSINPILQKNGQDITILREDDFTFNCIGTDEYWYDQHHQIVEFYEPGKYVIEVGYPKIGFNRSYTVNISETAGTKEEYYVIEGAEKIRPLENDKEIYSVEYYVNGVETTMPSTGNWRYNSEFISNIKEGYDFIDIEFNGTPGMMKLEFLVGYQVVATKEISVLTLFG